MKLMDIKITDHGELILRKQDKKRKTVISYVTMLSTYEIERTRNFNLERK